MEAARWWGPSRVEIGDAAVPSIGDDEALVEVAWVGLCGSDLEEWRAGPVVARPGTVLGHEISGRVATPARDGTGFVAGTPVVVDVVTGCGACLACRHHDEGRCPDLVVTGQHVDGGLARYVRARASRLIPVPPSMTLRQAALAEPTAVAVRAVRRASVELGDSVVVVGGGAVGQLVVDVMRGAGAGTVVVVEPRGPRQRAARARGAVPVWEDDAARLREAVGAVLPSRGADVVLECAGRPGTAQLALDLTRPAGRTVLLGVVADLEPIHVLDLVLSEKTMIGSSAHMWDDDVATAVDLIARGVVRVDDLTTHERPLAETREAFVELETDPSVMKMLVRVAGESTR